MSATAVPAFTFGQIVDKPECRLPPPSHWHCDQCKRVLAEALCRHCEKQGQALYLDGPFA